MLEIFVLNFCLYQGTSSQTCRSSYVAYYAQVDGQKYVDNINKKWLEPLPADVKDAGVIVGATINRKLHVKLSKNFALETSPTENTLNFRMEWK